MQVRAERCRLARARNKEAEEALKRELSSLLVAQGHTPLAPSPSKTACTVAVEFCNVETDAEGKTAFVCRYPGCAKAYNSRDAVRKHARQRHLEWLRGQHPL